mmetsp:Transcript_98117/g.225108  ORF Transcript_98117/g.225108 Transcript_98117/m.225108 type:complete len:203 (+) Transcript_98117:734-1342(+)
MALKSSSKRHRWKQLVQCKTSSGTICSKTSSALSPGVGPKAASRSFAVTFPQPDASNRRKRLTASSGAIPFFPVVAAAKLKKVQPSKRGGPGQVTSQCLGLLGEHHEVFLEGLGDGCLRDDSASGGGGQVVKKFFNVTLGSSVPLAQGGQTHAVLPHHGKRSVGRQLLQHGNRHRHLCWASAADPWMGQRLCDGRPLCRIFL